MQTLITGYDLRVCVSVSVGTLEALWKIDWDFIFGCSVTFRSERYIEYSWYICDHLAGNIKLSFIMHITMIWMQAFCLVIKILKCCVISDYDYEPRCFNGVSGLNWFEVVKRALRLVRSNHFDESLCDIFIHFCTSKNACIFFLVFQ